ncbi:hypothetical protein BH09VER1_BH09VER1_25570 [soil metagenome]
MMKREKSNQARSRRGFSLVEILAVLAVTAVLGSLVLPAISSVTTSMRITRATQEVVDELQFARSTALARNCPVEVWFLQDGAASSGAIQGVRSMILEGPNTRTWLSRLRRLPDGVGIASSFELSSIIGSQTLTAPDSANSTSKGAAIRIYPSGRLELASEATTPPSQFFLTLGSSQALAANSSRPPTNFATVQMSPINARVVTLRP